MLTFDSRNLAIVVLLFFIALAVFCAWTATAMNMDKAINDCVPYKSEAVLCSTNPQNYVSAWQYFLSVIPQNTFNLFLLVFFLGIVLVAYNIFLPRAPEVSRNFIAREYRVFDSIDPIRRALARGIIQPQIYELVTR